MLFSGLISTKVSAGLDRPNSTARVIKPDLSALEGDRLTMEVINVGEHTGCRVGRPIVVVDAVVPALIMRCELDLQFRLAHKRKAEIIERIRNDLEDPRGEIDIEIIEPHENTRPPIARDGRLDFRCLIVWLLADRVIEDRTIFLFSEEVGNPDIGSRSRCRSWAANEATPGD